MENKPPPGLVKREDNLFTRQSREVISLFRSLQATYLFQFLGSVCIILLTLFILKAQLFGRFENVVYDFFFRVRPPLASQGDIVFIQIAEDSIQAIGRWPWPRYYHGVLGHILSEWGAKAIVFDMIFSEPSQEFDDGAFEEALATSKAKIYLPVVLETRKEQKVWVHSLPRFEKHAIAIGHVNAVPDNDGVIRRIRPYIHADKSYPHLALQIAYDEQGIRPPPEKDLPFKKDEDGNLLINWIGKWKTTFQHYSYRDILKSYQLMRQGKEPLVSSEAIKGKICIIGLTATGLLDIKATPIESIFPAIGVNATLIQNTRENRFVGPASYGMNALCLSIVGLLAVVCFLPFRNLVSFLGGLGIAGGWVLFAFFLFARNHLWFCVFHPIVLILTLFIFSALYDHTVAKRERAHLFGLATRDGLTGLFVIRHFREILNKAVEDARIRKRPLSLLVLDIDDFKKINDTYGHLAGDQVLKEVSRIIYACSRSKRPFAETDYVGRYGGEEFIVMLRGAELTETAFKISDRIRKTIENTLVPWHGKKIRFTVSIGIASLGDGELVPDPMVLRADEALYRAKREGKNRVCLERFSSADPSVDQNRPSA